MGSCRCYESEITSTDWHERFDAAKCKCPHNGRLHAEENRRKIKICGVDYKSVDKIKVDGDGGLFPKGHAGRYCDYFFGHISNDSAFYVNNVFVELKGSGVKQANSQIISTVNNFKTNSKLSSDSIINGVIITGCVPKATGSTEVNRFKKVAGKDSKLHIRSIRNHPLEYDIVNNKVAN